MRAPHGAEAATAPCGFPAFRFATCPLAVERVRASRLAEAPSLGLAKPESGGLDDLHAHGATTDARFRGRIRAAFEEMNKSVPEDVLKRWKQVYVCRDVSDSNVILSFGLFDGSLDELREIQDSAGGEQARREPMAGLVEAVLLDGSYEVIEQITP
jgi:hypothetical protein